MPDSVNPGLRVAIYARVSTEEQREGQTIDSQVAELERFSREKAWLVAGIYRDEGWSGAVMERPELDHLRDDAQNGLFDAVLINDVDRLARDVAHLGVIKRDLERGGIKVQFRNLPSETSPTYNLMVNILGSFAEFEREMIADRTRRGRRHKIEVRKQYLGSNTAYGYRYTPMDRATGKEGLLEIEPREAKIVRQMFEWVDEEGLSARQVMFRLNQLGIRSQAGSSKWAKSSVLRILHREMYSGIWHYNKYQACEPPDPASRPRYRKSTKCSLKLRPKSEWLPLELPVSLRIVPHERWERVQEQLARNLCFSPRNEKHRYLLKGLVRCGGCGARYIGDPCHGKFYYRCLKRCKRVPTVRDSVLDTAVKEAVAELILKPEFFLEPLRELQQAEQRESRSRKDARDTARRELQQVSSEEERVLDAYRKGIISPAQLATQLQQFKGRRTELDLAVSREAVSVAPETIRAVEDYCSEAARNLSSFSQGEWQSLLRSIIKDAVFNGASIAITARIPLPDPEVASISVTRETLLQTARNNTLQTAL